MGDDVRDRIRDLREWLKLPLSAKPMASHLSSTRIRLSTTVELLESEHAARLKAEAFNERITCAWCKWETSRLDEGWAERVTDHIEACEKNPLSVARRYCGELEKDLEVAIESMGAQDQEMSRLTTERTRDDDEARKLGPAAGLVGEFLNPAQTMYMVRTAVLPRLTTEIEAEREKTRSAEFRLGLQREERGHAEEALEQERALRQQAEGFARDYGAEAAENEAECSRLAMEVGRANTRATEMHRRAQQAESKAQAEAGNWESLYTKLSASLASAKQWTEDHALCSDWSAVPEGPFWIMSSANSRIALASLVGERDDLTAENTRLRAAAQPIAAASWHKPATMEQRRALRDALGEEDPTERLDRLLGGAGFKFWVCPEGHSMTGKPRVTVTWDGDVATCTICGKTSQAESEEGELLYGQAVAEVKRAGKGSPSNLQRRLKIGYHVADGLLDRMEKEGIVGPADGARPREVLHEGRFPYDSHGIADTCLHCGQDCRHTCEPYLEAKANWDTYDGKWVKVSKNAKCHDGWKGMSGLVIGCTDLMNRAKVFIEQKADWVWFGLDDLELDDARNKAEKEKTQ